MAAQIRQWEPEDAAFWAQEGGRVARRNLVFSVPPLMLSFAVWMLWSMLVVELPRVGYRFSTDQLFWLAALPGLAGGTLRLFFAFLVPVLGGRTWTTVSTLLLGLPALGMAFALQDLDTSYPAFVLLALLCGIGGGNFASSMANISLFYPNARRGEALGWNAGLGNLGVSLAQFAVPLAIAFGLFGALGGAPQTWSDGQVTHPVWLQNAGLIWLPLILAAAAAAWVGMDDLAAWRLPFEQQAVVFVRADTWLLSWLYLGTFGSFIGFAAGFPLLARTEFGATTPLGWAFALPLAAALTRPLGGWLADRLGGARVALASFLGMATSVAALLAAPGAIPGDANYSWFIALFALLFVGSGLGNGALFHMIPAHFAAQARRRDGAARAALQQGAIEGAGALGFASAIAAFGGFFIPKSYGTSLTLTGGASGALGLFLLFYLSCIAVLWWRYLRRSSPAHVDPHQPAVPPAR
jgi:NNP family nitrate/nitrite transporter-like MFS transporter